MKRFPLLLGPLVLLARLASPADTLPPEVRSVLNQIQANELKGDLSFLASDILQGRFTPSPGLEVAAEFIAAKFRAAGLEPGAPNDYFQLAEMVERRPRALAGGLIVKSGAETFTVDPASIALTNVNATAHIVDAPVITFARRDPDLLHGVDLTGKVVLVPIPELAKAGPEDRRKIMLDMRTFDRIVGDSKAALEVTLSPRKPAPPAARLLFAEETRPNLVPGITVESSQLGSAKEPLTISLDLPAPDDRPVVVKNVIGILRGSDPELKNTCVLLTAHYDHIGTTDTAGRTAMSGEKGGDRIFNGANDDGSGTVSVIEIARALSHLNPHPKRSIVFMTFFGEERGEFGSRYYGQHPVFPIDKTVADVNLEQIGRTDATTGKQIKTASLTGYDYSDVTTYLAKAGKLTGVRVYKDEEASDAYFTRSDNDALAEQGVPAHSLSVAFDFPDYHKVGDEWQKIDYDNMAAVDRMVALGLINIANSRIAPEWNAANRKTEPFRQAQRKQRK